MTFQCIMFIDKLNEYVYKIRLTLTNCYIRCQLVRAAIINDWSTSLAQSEQRAHRFCLHVASAVAVEIDMQS